jgi:hypothetical protein
MADLFSREEEEKVKEIDSIRPLFVAFFYNWVVFGFL